MPQSRNLRLSRRLRRNDSIPRGQSLVEFALVLPLFVLLLFGLFDLGRVIYAQHVITQDSREATRKGQVQPADYPDTEYYSAAQYAAIRAAALAQSVGLQLADADITGEAGTPCSSVGVVPAPADDPVDPSSCFYPEGSGAGKRVVVNISITVPLLTPIIGQIVGDSIVLSAQSVSYIQ